MSTIKNIAQINNNKLQFQTGTNPKTFKVLLEDQNTNASTEVLNISNSLQHRIVGKLAAGGIGIKDFNSPADFIGRISLIDNHNIGDLYNVDTTSTAAVIDDLLQYDGANWVNVNPTNISATFELGDINKVNITNPEDGDLLQYDGTNWVNIDPTNIGATSFIFETLGNAISGTHKFELLSDKFIFKGTNSISVSFTNNDPEKILTFALMPDVIVEESLYIGLPTNSSDSIRMGPGPFGNFELYMGSNLMMSASVNTTNVSIKQNLEVLKNANIDGNLIVNGNFTVNGTTVLLDVVEQKVEDGIIELNYNDTFSASDIGFIGQISSGVAAGLFFDNVTSKLIAFKDMDYADATNSILEPTNINTYATFDVGTINLQGSAHIGHEIISEILFANKNYNNISDSIREELNATNPGILHGQFYASVYSSNKLSQSFMAATYSIFTDANLDVNYTYSVNTLVNSDSSVVSLDFDDTSDTISVEITDPLAFFNLKLLPIHNQFIT